MTSALTWPLPPGRDASLPPADGDRRTWLLATGAAGGVAAAGLAIPLVSSLAPSERAKAAGGPVEVEIGDLPPGGIKTVEWRGNPVWVMRRSPEMIASLAGHDAQLVDPLSARDQQPGYATNPFRAARPEVFVAIGICTHLGCSPSEKFAPGTREGMTNDWPGGFLCPCHGSTFDLAGRVYLSQPAPTNLEIPPYKWLSAGVVVVGEDDQGSA